MGNQLVRGDARRVRQVLVALVEERLLRMTSGTLAVRCVEGATEGQWRFELSPEGPLRERPASAGLPLALELARRGCPLCGDTLYGARAALPGGGIALRAVALALGPVAARLGLPQELRTPEA